MASIASPQVFNDAAIPHPPGPGQATRRTASASLAKQLRRRLLPVHHKRPRWRHHTHVTNRLDGAATQDKPGVIGSSKCHGEAWTILVAVMQADRTS